MRRTGSAADEGFDFEPALGLEKASSEEKDAPGPVTEDAAMMTTMIRSYLMSASMAQSALVSGRREAAVESCERKLCGGGATATASTALLATLEKMDEVVVDVVCGGYCVWGWDEIRRAS